MKRLLVTQRLFEDTIPTAFQGSSIEVKVRDAREPLDPGELALRLKSYNGVICLLTDRLDGAVLKEIRSSRSSPTWPWATTTSTLPSPAD